MIDKHYTSASQASLLGQVPASRAAVEVFKQVNQAFKQTSS